MIHNDRGDDVRCGRFAVHSRPAPDDDPGRASVPERAQDLQRHPSGPACVNSHQCLVHRRRLRSSGQYSSSTSVVLGIDLV